MEFVLGNGHTIAVETANRGLEDDYKITFFEDGKQLGPSQIRSKILQTSPNMGLFVV